MRLGIMQPYFAPGLGYFDLIGLCDEWIVFDTPQFRRKSWMHRNRVLHPTSGWQYLSAQTGKVHLGTRIHQVTVQADSAWRSHMLAQLDHYRKQAPHFAATVDLLARCLEVEDRSLARLSVRLLSEVCDLLSISFQPRYFSEMSMDIGPVEHPGHWALRISQALGAEEYVNPPGGRDLFDEKEFAEAGVQLRIRSFDDMVYPTGRYDFLPGLSIVDVLMWNSPEDISRYLSAQREDLEPSNDRVHRGVS